MRATKQQVHDFWNDASCGEALYLHAVDRHGYGEQSRIRYQLEPYILDLARFGAARGMRVPEIGVGLGADHQKYAEAGADLYGIDLTERAIQHARRRLSAYGLVSSLWVRYALLGLRPWLSLSQVYAQYLESPGTKAYSIPQARVLRIDTVLSHADLLESDAGQRHRGMLLSVARKLWPRALIRRLLAGFGLCMLIEARK